MKLALITIAISVMLILAGTAIFVKMTENKASEMGVDRTLSEELASAE